VEDFGLPDLEVGAVAGASAVAESGALVMGSSADILLIG
jgi:hypothetical protein